MLSIVSNRTSKHNECFSFVFTSDLQQIFKEKWHPISCPRKTTITRLRRGGALGGPGPPTRPRAARAPPLSPSACVLQPLMRAPLSAASTGRAPTATRPPPPPRSVRRRCPRTPLALPPWKPSDSNEGQSEEEVLKKGIIWWFPMASESFYLGMVYYVFHPYYAFTAASLFYFVRKKQRRVWLVL